MITMDLDLVIVLTGVCVLILFMAVYAAAIMYRKRMALIPI